MSFIVLVVKVPMGVVSNLLSGNPRIFLKTLLRKSFTTFCPSQAVIKVKVKRTRVSITINRI